MENWRDTLDRNQICLMEAVNFIDAGYGRYSDLTWLFAVENDVAKNRLMARNSLDSSSADQRLASQKHWTIRAPAADIITHPEWFVFMAQVVSTFPLLLIPQADVGRDGITPAQAAENRSQCRTLFAARPDDFRRLLPAIATVKLVP